MRQVKRDKRYRQREGGRRKKERKKERKIGKNEVIHESKQDKVIICE